MTSSYLTLPEVAARLRLSISTVRRAARCGALPAYRFGGAYRVDLAELDAYADRSRIRIASPTPRQRDRLTRSERIETGARLRDAAMKGLTS